MLRGIRILLASIAVIFAANDGAIAERPPIAGGQPLAAVSGAILADPALDSLPTLNIPEQQQSTSNRVQRLAQTGCPNDPNKTGGGKDQSQSPKTNCPVSPEIHGGAQEAGPSFVAEQVDYNQYDFSSPIYTTFKGQLFGTTEFDFSGSSLEIFRAGAKTGSERINQLEFTQVLRYGVTDALSIEASISESPSDIIKEVNFAVPTKTVSGGWQDPGFIVVYRALSQPGSPIYLDFTAEYYPNAFLSLPATGTQQFNFEESVGHAFGDLTLEGIAETTWVGERRDGAETASSFWNEQYELEAFYRFSDRWSASVDAENQLIGHNDGPFFAHGQINYYLIPDRLQATIEYEHGFVYNPRPVPVGSYDRHEQSDTVGVRLGYLFDLGLNGN